MVTFEQAHARFSRAVDRIEEALQRDAEQVGEIATLRADRGRLAGDLARLRKDHETLVAAASAISGRLEGTIARVRTLLDE